MTTKTYWLRHPQDFANQFVVGIATSPAHGEQYAAEGFDRINRAEALRRLCYRGDRATAAYVSATLDGRDVYDRFSVARQMRAGETVTL